MNFYNPYAPNMFGAPMPPIQQRPMFPEPQQYSPVQQAGGMVWVNGFNEANNYPVPPNSVIPLWDKNGHYVYRRAADAAGQPSTRIFQLNEVSNAQSEPEFLTKQEFQQFLNSINYQPKFTAKEEPAHE